ncbi:hypothetical protein BJ508DRAFT_313426 [Ascobolus immersus RN42]|uniref:Uncharacterized protein n=1 Tax=Ascobolus immersus RN42 TaxID=1160509 RepID=A0A3N4HKQ8_ASCIM|nr:hypothetical protein BJ508DRAFT_313426 [Ascobolus immersus RN42]
MRVAWAQSYDLDEKQNHKVKKLISIGTTFPIVSTVTSEAAAATFLSSTLLTTTIASAEAQPAIDLQPILTRSGSFNSWHTGRIGVEKEAVVDAETCDGVSSTATATSYAESIMSRDIQDIPPPESQAQQHLRAILVRSSSYASQRSTTTQSSIATSSSTESDETVSADTDDFPITQRSIASLERQLQQRAKFLSFEGDFGIPVPEKPDTKCIRIGLQLGLLGKRWEQLGWLGRRTCCSSHLVDDGGEDRVD